MHRAERLAGILSLCAGAVHGLAGPEHFSQWWAYSLFFLAAALAQLVFGLLLLTRGVDPERVDWDRFRPALCWAGIAGNLAIMALWVVTRTLGIPAGPEAGEVEPVGVLDAVSKALETILVIVLVRMLWRRPTALAGG